MTRRQCKIFFKCTLFIIGVCGLLLGCSGQSISDELEKKVESLQPIAWVGPISVSQKEFLKRYREHEKNETIDQVLNTLMDEKLLLLEADKKEILSQRAIREIWRKAMVQQLIKRDFEKWYNPKTIHRLTLRQYYRKHYFDFNQPERLKCVHLLFPFPRGFSKVPKTKEEKRLWKEKDIEIAMRGRSLFSLLRKSSPKDAKGFKEFSVQWMEKMNRPDPSLLSIVGQLEALHQDGSRPSKIFLSSLETYRDELLQRRFCLSCQKLAKTFENRLFQLKRSARLSDDEEKNFWKKTRALASVPRQVVKFEDLTLFPAKYTSGLRNVVKEFSDAARTLNDREFSSNLVKTSFGYHIIFRQYSVPSKETSFRDVSEKIRQTLFKKNRYKKFQHWIQQKITGYTVQYHYERLRKLRERS